jgi:hypothetical protein
MAALPISMPIGPADRTRSSCRASASADNFAAHVLISDVGADTLITIAHHPGQTVLLTGFGNATTIGVDDFRFA